MTDNGEYYSGLECPKCGCRHFYVIYTRRVRGKIKRRRECRSCGRRVSTYEQIVPGMDVF